MSLCTFISDKLEVEEKMRNKTSRGCAMTLIGKNDLHSFAWPSRDDQFICDLVPEM
jgi:hypothetical protein